MQPEHPTKLDRQMHAVAEHHLLQAGTSFSIHGFGVRFESNSAKVVAAIREHFAPYLCEPPQTHLSVVAIDSNPPDLGLDFQEWGREPRCVGHRGHRDEYVDISGGRVVRNPQSGLQFLLGPDISLAVGACARHPAPLIELVNARYTEHLVQRGWLACNAAAVARGDDGIVLCGAPGIGKSSLALRLLERGAALLSSDRVMVSVGHGEPRMLGVPSLVRVNPGTMLATSRLAGLLTSARASALTRLTMSDLWALEDKQALPLPALFGVDSLQLTAAVRAIVALRWQPGRLGTLDVERCRLRERPELTGFIAKRPGPFCRSSVRAHGGSAPVVDLAPYLEQLGELPVLELRGGVDFEAATEHCLSLLA